MFNLNIKGMVKGIKTGNKDQDSPTPLIKGMRAILKGIIAKELELLPEALDKMEPEKRIDILLKLLPYVLPKVEVVSMYENEPLGSSFDL
jgi:hypothetical protein